MEKRMSVQNYCINAQQFDLNTLNKICELTDKIRKLSETEEGLTFLSSLLPNKRAMLYFKQPSTRTFLSFQNACYILGIKTSEIRDVTTSSEMKGESELDAVKTFSQYVDLVIMRHRRTDFIYEIADHLDQNIKIINGGSGNDQHPTQALLDFYTIYKYGLHGKKIGFVGDLKNGRTVRSLALLLNLIPDIELYFIAPESYQIKSDITNKLKVNYHMTEDFDGQLSELDVIYMTRLQSEYEVNNQSDLEFNHRDFDHTIYRISGNNLSKVKEDAIILHPLPRVTEIAPEVDKDKRAKYWEQVKNGMWTRVALISMMFNVDEKINEGPQYIKK